MSNLTALTQLESEIEDLRDILLRLVNHRPNSKIFKEAKNIAIDKLSRPKLTRHNLKDKFDRYWVSHPENRQHVDLGLWE